MEDTSPSRRVESSSESFERKVERWTRKLGEHIEENYFYELLEKWLKDECQSVKIWLDENPYVDVSAVYGIDHIEYGRAYYVNEIVCDNTVYELDIEYTFYEFIDQDTFDKTVIIHSVDSVSVRKVEEQAGEQAGE
jgi:aminoglycoside phosphotransferase (APT) family kinase protein